MSEIRIKLLELHLSVVQQGKGGKGKGALPLVLRKPAVAGVAATAELPGRAEGLAEQSRGEPLSGASRQFMEAFFGRRLEGVRLHSDQASREASRELGAEAFTVGREIYLGDGKGLDTPEGLALLGHEVAHVVQQERGADQPRLGDAQHHEAASKDVERQILEGLGGGRGGFGAERVSGIISERFAPFSQGQTAFTRILGRAESPTGLVERAMSRAQPLSSGPGRDGASLEMPFGGPRVRLFELPAVSEGPPAHQLAPTVEPVGVDPGLSGPVELSPPRRAPMPSAEMGLSTAGVADAVKRWGLRSPLTWTNRLLRDRAMGPAVPAAHMGALFEYDAAMALLKAPGGFIAPEGIPPEEATDLSPIRAEFDWEWFSGILEDIYAVEAAGLLAEAAAAGRAEPRERWVTFDRAVSAGFAAATRTREDVAARRVPVRGAVGPELMAVGMALQRLQGKFRGLVAVLGQAASELSGAVQMLGAVRTVLGPVLRAAEAASPGELRRLLEIRTGMVSRYGRIQSLQTRLSERLRDGDMSGGRRVILRIVTELKRLGKLFEREDRLFSEYPEFQGGWFAFPETASGLSSAGVGRLRERYREVGVLSKREFTTVELRKAVREMEVEVGRAWDTAQARAAETAFDGIGTRLREGAVSEAEEHRAGQRLLDALSKQGDQTFTLDVSTRHRMESALGVELDDVVVHVGRSAELAARSLKADAFAIGRHVFFGEGKFDPESREGEALLAHELMHVWQAKGEGRASGVRPTQETLEAEAHAQEARVKARTPAAPAKPPQMVHRQASQEKGAPVPVAAPAGDGKGALRKLADVEKKGKSGKVPSSKSDKGDDKASDYITDIMKDLSVDKDVTQEEFLSDMVNRVMKLFREEAVMEIERTGTFVGSYRNFGGIL